MLFLSQLLNVLCCISLYIFFYLVLFFQAFSTLNYVEALTKFELLLLFNYFLQMAYLDDWDTVESDQGEYLSGMITALQNAAVRVPVGSDVKVRFFSKALRSKDSNIIQSHINTHLFWYKLTNMQSGIVKVRCTTKH